MKKEVIEHLNKKLDLKYKHDDKKVLDAVVKLTQKVKV